MSKNPAPAPATKTDKRNRLFAECDLVREDMFEHQHYTILTRSGIEKVQAHYKITVTYKALKLEPQYVVIKAIATMGDARVETYGSAVLANCKNSYFAETAEKRALSRAVLKLTGLYQHGFFGEEESEQLTAEAKANANSNNASGTVSPWTDEEYAHYANLLRKATSKIEMREIFSTIPKALAGALTPLAKEFALKFAVVNE